MSEENFSEEQLNLLERFFTNTDSNVFVLKNLPEVIKGALFSRYSRAKWGLRTLLLKEFISDEILFKENKEFQDEQLLTNKAHEFYDRILDGYGDDSVGELGGAHLALENISMFAAKVIQDCRIGGSPLEKSARYVYFDEKVEGKYQYIREPAIMSSAFGKLYEATCDKLFDTYSSLIPPLTEKLGKQFPQGQDQSTGAYKAALRAKVLDCLRGLLPASTKTNMGVFGNGRFFEALLQKLQTHPLQEMKELGLKSHTELSKVIPSFVRRATPSHHTHLGFKEFSQSLKGCLKNVTSKYAFDSSQEEAQSVLLTDYSKDAVTDVAAALLYEESSLSLHELKKRAKELPLEAVDEIFQAASASRKMRRHKSPRGLEHAFFTFDLCSDFGAYRDLQRHRILTQERQLLTTDLGYFVPSEILGTEMEAPYREALDSAKECYDTIRELFPMQAQYVVPLAYRLRYYFNINLRGLQWLTELRSSAAGHPTYRLLAQEMAKQVITTFPQFKCFFHFVDFEGYALGRLDQEISKEKKRAALVTA